jgi:hypothetical protein
MKLATLAIPILTAAYASAHGYLHSITIDGHSYSGNKPGAANSPSVIRQVADQGPVKGAKNKDMNCGLGSPKIAALDATANPGDSISFDWTSIDGGNVSSLNDSFDFCQSAYCVSVVDSSSWTDDDLYGLLW